MIIDHGYNIISFYAHLLKPLAKKQDYINRDQVIALSGESGSLEGPILYFEMLNNGKPENPMLWLKPEEK